jgi:hypothetical protein
MMATAPRIDDLSGIRLFVHEVLCQFNQLEAGIFQMTEKVLTRSGNPCGMFFCLHGPRSIKLTAVWETDGNTVLFYGSTGERQHKAQLELGGSKLLDTMAAIA